MKVIEERDSKNETNVRPLPIRAGDKVARDDATKHEGKVYLGDAAPVFHR